MKKILIALIILVLAEAFVIGCQMFHSRTGTPRPIGTDVSVSATTTVKGVFTCLPHKGNGPSTMECAYGMKGNDGAHYALDFSGMAESAFDLPMGIEYSVTGLYVPVEALSSDHWRVYDIKGVIKVSSYAAPEPVSQTIPANGKVTLELKKPFRTGDTTLVVTAVTEDSRCPSDVTCIQAGRVKASVSLTTASGQANPLEITIGQTFASDAMSFTLDSVTPAPVSTHHADDSEYRFVFTVKKK